MKAALGEKLEHVRLRLENNVGWLEFSRAPVNAFNHAMVHEVIAGFEALHMHRDVRVIVLASALERYFSAGAELGLFAGIGEQGMVGWSEMVHALVRKFRGSSKPMLAAVHGTAVGGGLEMTLHCDIRFAAHDARLGQPEVNINFIPPVGATQALVRMLGRSKALRYLYDGELIGADQALAIGLVDEVVPAPELRDNVQQYAETLCAKPPEALAGIRRAITEGGARNFEEGLRIERDIAVSLAGSANFEEGVRAFLDKRPPRWVR